VNRISECSKRLAALKLPAVLFSPRFGFAIYHVQKVLALCHSDFVFFHFDPNKNLLSALFLRPHSC